MAAYHYDKSVLKGLSVSPFLGEVGARNAKIEEAPDTMPVSIFNANRLAASLHPGAQFCKVSEVIDHGQAVSFVLVPDPEKGTGSLAFFRAGQYISVYFDMGEYRLNKPYSIRSGPGDALRKGNSSYTITIQRNPGGFASSYAIENWKVGSSVVISGPLGYNHYQPLRDAKQVVALAGGSGITPFFSMASAIADGIEDFDLTILYGSRDEASILLRDELEAIAARSGGRVRVIHVLSKEQKEGFEYGFINAEIIKKYAPEGDYSVFICGPGEMYKFLQVEKEKLGLPRRRIRFEISGEFGDPSADELYPKAAEGKTFNVTVRKRGSEKTVPCLPGQSIMQALERGGIYLPSDCRSGQCSWCRSRLVSGEIFAPASHDGRREADKKFGWIHPCVSYPLSDITIEPPESLLDPVQG